MQIAMAQALSVQPLFDLFDHSEADLRPRALGQNQQTREWKVESSREQQALRFISYVLIYMFKKKRKKVTV